MIVKIIGALAVTAAGTALGLYYAGLDSFRMRDLQEFKKALHILASEIEYVSAPLPEAMAHIATRVAEPARSLFGDFAGKLTQNAGETAYRLWADTAEAHRKRACLTAEDWEVLTSFGKTLGYLDKSMQLNAIRLAVDYIDGKTAFLKDNGEKSRRMYRSLGVLGGLLAAVALW